MKYFTDKERVELVACDTVGEMIDYLQNNFDLQIIPPALKKHLLVMGFDNALNQLQPRRKNTTGKRVRKPFNKSNL